MTLPTPAAPLHLLCIRHGAVINPFGESEEVKVYGNTDVDLSDLGKTQARDAAAFLATDAVTLEDGTPLLPNVGLVLHSGLSRAKYGADQVHHHCPHVPIIVDSDFEELGRGNWNGLTKTEIYAQHDNAYERLCTDEEFRPDNGENLFDLQRRVLRGLTNTVDLCRAKGVTCAVLVAHNWVIRVLVAHARCTPLISVNDIKVPLASLSTFTVGSAVENTEGEAEVPSLKEVSVGVLP